MKHLNILSICFACLVAWASCSVKENRSECLGQYTLHIPSSPLPVGDSDSLHIQISPAGGKALIYSFPSDDIPPSISVQIPQGTATVTAYSGAGGSVGFESGFTISKGSEFPPLFLSRKTPVIVAGHTSDTLSMHKRFSSVCLMLSYDDPENPYRLRITGDTDGYDSALNPHRGGFLVDMDSFSGVKRIFNLPQQTDGSLVLELSDPYSGLFRRFAIGQMIIESGFDWNAPDLEDVVLTLSYSTTQMKMVIQGWGDEYVFDISL